MGLNKMKPPITSAQAMSHTAVFETVNSLGKMADELRAEVEALTKERDIAVRKLSALSSAHALENLYQAGLDQEREITRLKKERDALAEDAARYRFITGHIVDEGDMGVLERAFEWMQAEFDACIDAAIAKEQRQAGVQ